MASPEITLAQTLAREVEKCPDLARLFALWPDLPDAGKKLLVTTAETLAGQLNSKRKATSSK
jgi:hypothetical protein